MLFLCDECGVPGMDDDDAEDNRTDSYQTIWLSQTPLAEPVEGHDAAATATDLTAADSTEECAARVGGHQHHRLDSNINLVLFLCSTYIYIQIRTKHVPLLSPLQHANCHSHC